MTEAAARGRFAAATSARLATVSPQGQPQVVPIVFALADNTLWTAVDSKPKSSPDLQRLANIRAHPRVSILVDHYDADWSKLWWVRADGAALVVDADSDPGRRGTEQLMAKYDQYQSDPPRGPVIVVQVDTWRWWSWSGT